MALPSETRFYRYMVESLNIIFPDEGIHYEIDGKLVLGLMIERDYDNDFFPVIKLDLSLETQLYHKIIANSSTVKFRLRVQKYIYDQNNKLAMREDVFNDIFVVFLDENTPFLDKTEFEKARAVTSSSGATGSTPATVGGNDITLYLFKEHELMHSKDIVNTVIKEGTMTDTIAYMMASTGFSKILMTPLDNKSVYNEIVIPPISLLGSLIYLESQFGYYTKGALIFFDIDCLYIINKTPKCTAWRKGEYHQTMFTVKDSMNAEKLSSGSYFDEEQNTTFINVKPNDITMNTASAMRDQLTGNNLLLISGARGVSKNIKTDTYQRGEGTYKVLYNKYNNPYMDSAEQNRVESNSQIIELALHEIDIDAITPNKEFAFKFEDTDINRDYGGTYRISNSLIALTNSGDHFKSHMTATFKK